MKMLILKLLLLVVVFTQCAENRKADDNFITISGNIDGHDGEIITLISFEELKKVEVNNDGSFSITFNYDHEWYFSLLVSDYYFRFFLEPGDSIYFSVDINNISATYRPSGDKAKEAVFLEKKHQKLNDVMNWRELIGQEREKYFKKKEELIVPLRQLIMELETQKGLNNNFIKLEKADIDYFDLHMDNTYLTQYRRKHNIPEGADIDFPEKEVLDKIKNIDFNNPLMLLNTYHRIFMEHELSELRADLYNKVPESEKGNNVVFAACIMKAADSLFHNPRVRDFIKYRHLSIMMGQTGPTDYLEIYEQFLADNTTPMYSERLTQIIEKWSAFEPGMEVPEFVFADINGNKVKLSDSSGNLTYIKVWITGCGNCIYEQSFWNKLIAEYNDKGITFLAISFDKEKDPWIEMVKEKDILGFNWYAENAINSECAALYDQVIPQIYAFRFGKKNNKC